MIRGTPGHHPSITRERLDKALDPLYLREADTNLCDIRYAAACPVSIGHFAVRPVDSRPLFKDVVPAATESNLFVPIHIGHSFGPSWSTHWLRVDFEVPVTWQEVDNTVHFRFDSSCEAMLYSFDGLPLQGFTGGDKDTYRGNRRAEFDLKALDFRPGKSTVFIEIACNGLFGCGGATMISAPEERKTFQLVQCDLALVSTEGTGLFWDFVVLRDLVEHAPKGSFIGERALVVANELLNVFKNRQPSTFPLCRKLASSLLCLLTAHADASVAPAEASPVVHAVGHCHIDTAWLWPFAETRRKVARSWVTQMQYSKYVNPQYVFAASQMVQYEWLCSDYPEIMGLLQAGIRAGNFVPVGASWVEPDVNVPSGESLIRQFLFGAQAETKLLGESLAAAEISRAKSCSTSVRARIPHGQGVFWLPDTFGYNAQLPQIMRGCGLPFFLTQKLSWSLLNKPEHNTFWWQGLDGSVVLAHFPPADDYNAQATVGDVLKSSNNNKDKGRAGASIMLFGNGDGGGGPNMPMFEQLSRMGASTGVARRSCPDTCLPRVQLSSPRTFFESLAAEVARHDVTKWRGELFLELHQGTFTTQACTKKLNRALEQYLHDAEFLCTVASLGAVRSSSDFRYPQVSLADCWRDLLLCQFHDVLPGSSIACVYEDANALLSSCIAKCRLHYSQAASHLVQVTHEGTSSQFALFNSCGHPREEILSISGEDQRRYLYAVSAPAYGFSIVNLEETVPDVQVDCGVPELPINDRLPSPASLPVPEFEQPPVYDPAKGIFVFASRLSCCAPGERCIFVDNGLLRVAISCSSGRILSLLDYRFDRPREFIKTSSLFDEVGIQQMFGANAFVVYSDVPWYWDAWDVFPYHLEKGYAQGGNAAHVAILTTGPLQCRVRVTLPRVGEHSWVQQDIVVNRSSPVLEFPTVVDWREAHKLLKVEFPTMIRSPVASYEIQFGCVTRPTHANTSRDLMQFEVCGQRFADLSAPDCGLAIFSDCKYGYSCRDGKLALSLLRAPKSPDPHCDIGWHSFRYALHPHELDLSHSAVPQLARSFNNPLVPIPVTASQSAGKTCFFEVTSISGGSTTAVLDTIKVSENGDGVILRLYESLGHAASCLLHTRFSLLSVEPVNMLEESRGHEGLPVEADVRADLLQECAADGVKEAFARHDDVVPAAAFLKSAHLIEIQLSPFQVGTFRVRVEA